MSRLWKWSLSVLFGLTFSNYSKAQTYTWTGAGADNNWSTAGNWGGTAPVSSTTATFIVLDGTTNLSTNLSAAISINSLTFGTTPTSAGSFTVGTANSSALTIGSGGINVVSNSAQTISAPVTIAAAQTWTNSGTGLLTISGAITGSTYALATAGSGNITVSGGYTGTGALTIGGTGTVSLTGATAWAGGKITVNTGALYLGNATLTSTRLLDIAAGVSTYSTGTISTTANGSSTFSAVAGTSTTSIGTLVLASTTDSATILDINFNSNDTTNSTANYGSRIVTTVDLNGAMRYIGGSTNHNGVARYTTGADCVFMAPIIDSSGTGNGGITFVAQATYTGSGPMEVPFYLDDANTFTGPVVIQRGSVYLGTATSLNGNSVTFNAASGNNARLFLFGNSDTIGNLSSPGAGTAVIANSPGATYSGGYVAVGAATLTINQTASTTFSGTIVENQLEYVTSVTGTTGAFNIVLAGTISGNLTLTSGANSYTGSTTINGGTLTISTLALGGSNSSIGASSNAATNLVLNGGTLAYTGANVTTDRSFTVGSNGGTINVTTAGSVLTIGGQPNGAGNLTIGGSGSVAISGVFDTGLYTGILFSTGGGVNLSGGLNGTGPLTLAGTGPITISGTVNTNGTAPTFGGTFAVASGATATVSAQITGTGGITNSGPGVVNLTNATNNYTGLTTISTGTLRTVVSAANGNYTLTGGIFAVNYGTVASTFSIGALSTSGGALQFELNQTTNTTSSGSPLISAGSLTTGSNTTINFLNAAGSLPVGNYYLISYSGSPVTSGYTLGTLPTPRTAAALVYNSTSLVLDITGTDSIKWYGNLSTAWDTGTAVNVGGTNNWKSVTYGTATNFFTGDSVNFDDTASGSGPVSVTLANNVTPGSITTNNNTRTYTFSGAGAITGSTGLTMNGTGTIILANNNTFTGPVTVNAGTLQIGNGGTTGSIASTTITDNSALAFNLSSAYTYAGVIAGTGTLGVQGGSTLTLTGTNTYTGTTTVASGTTLQIGNGGTTGSVAGNITLNGAALTFNRSDSGLVYSGNIAGTGYVNKLGAGIVTLAGTANTFTGYVTVAGGELSVGDAAISGISIALTAQNGGLLQYTGSNGGTNPIPVTLGTGGGGFDITNSTVTLTGPFSGSGTFIKAGVGILNLSSSNSGGISGFNVTGGTLSVPAINSAASVALSGGSLFQYTGASATTSGSLAMGTGGGSIDVPSGTTLTFNGTLSGVGPLALVDNGTVVIAGTSTPSGTIAVNAGTLQVGTIYLQNASNGTGTNSTITIASGATLVSTGTIYLKADGTTNPNVLIGGGGTLVLASTTSSATNPDIFFNYNDSNNSTANWGTRIDAAINLGSSQRYFYGLTNHNSIVQYGLSGDCVFNGVISGSGGMTFIAQASYTGSGPMEVPFYLTQANTFTGMVEIQRGSVYLGNSGAIAQNNALLLDPATGNNARLFLYGYNASVSNLTSSGAGNALITNAPGGTATVAAATLTITQNNPTTYSGLITQYQAEYTTTTTGTYGALSIVLNGPSSLTLTGNNTFSGGVTINSGTLIVNNTAGSGTGTGAVTVNTGGALAGNGTISGAVNVNTGATISPSNNGTATVGTLTLSGGAAISGTYAWAMANAGTGFTSLPANGASSATASHDVLAVTGTLTATGAAINLIELAGTGFNSSQYYSWAIATSTGGLTGTPTIGTVSGPDFAGLSSQFSVVTDANNIYIDFTPTPTPEPMSILGFSALGLAVIGGIRRRRQK